MARSSSISDSNSHQLEASDGDFVPEAFRRHRA
jgi:hypothetical protein